MMINWHPIYNFKLTVVPICISFLFCGCSEPRSVEPVKTDIIPIRIVSQAEDLAVFQVSCNDFDNLTLQEQLYAYHLYRACVFGRDITYDQLAPHGLEIRKVIDASILNFVNPDGLENEYTVRFWAFNGNYHPLTFRKILPSEKSMGFWTRRIEKFKSADHVDLEPYLLDASLYPRLLDLSASNAKDLIENSSINLYDQRLTFDDLANFRDKHLINSRIVMKDSVPRQVIYKSGGDSARGALTEEISLIVSEVEAAVGYAPDNSRPALLELAEYLKSGDRVLLEGLKQLRINRRNNRVDYSLGFLEKSIDPLKVRGIFGGAVFIQDQRTGEIISTLKTKEDSLNLVLPKAVTESLRIFMRRHSTAYQMLCGTGAMGPFIGSAWKIKSVILDPYALGREYFITNLPYNSLTAPEEKVIRSLLPNTDNPDFVISAYQENKLAFQLLKYLIRLNLNTGLDVRDKHSPHRLFLENSLKTLLSIWFLLHHEEAGLEEMFSKEFDGIAFLKGFVMSSLAEIYYQNEIYSGSAAQASTNLFVTGMLISQEAIVLESTQSGLGVVAGDYAAINTVLSYNIKELILALRSTEDYPDQNLAAQAIIDKIPEKGKIIKQLEVLNLPLLYAIVYPEPELEHNKMGGITRVKLRIPEDFTSQMLCFAEYKD